MLLYALSMMEAYELLVYNEEYTGKLSTRLLKRLRGICPVSYTHLIDAIGISLRY